MIGSLEKRIVAQHRSNEASSGQPSPALELLGPLRSQRSSQIRWFFAPAVILHRIDLPRHDRGNRSSGRSRNGRRSILSAAELHASAASCQIDHARCMPSVAMLSVVNSWTSAMGEVSPSHLRGDRHDRSDVAAAIGFVRGDLSSTASPKCRLCGTDNTGTFRSARDSDVRFSNRPFGVKHFQTIHQCDVDVARGLVLLFGIGTGAFPSWDSRTRRNNLLVGLAVEERRVQADIRTHLIHRPARDIFPPLGGALVFSYRVHAAAVACSLVQQNSVPSTHMRCMITASRRAKATIAFFIPRRLAICMAHALSQDHFFECIML